MTTISAKLYHDKLETINIEAISIIDISKGRQPLYGIGE